MSKKNVKVTLVRSRFGRQPRHAACLVGLGLRKMHQSVVLEDTPSVRGMINKVYYLVNVEEA